MTNRLRGVLQWPGLHPALFWLYPVLFLWAENPYEASARQAMPLLALSSGLGFFYWLMLWRVARIRAPVAGGLATLSALLIFSYGRLYDAFRGGPAEFLGHHRVLLPASVGVAIAAGVWIAKPSRSRDGLTVFLNSSGLLLVAMAALRLAFTWVLPSDEVAVPKLLPADLATGGAATGDRPDVFYLVVDGYGREDVLRDTYGFDNGEFLGFLRSHGFHVLEQSHANYPTTLTSVSSTLTGSYLESSLSTELITERELYFLVRNSPVLKAFSDAGYSIYRNTALPFSVAPLPGCVEGYSCPDRTHLLEALLETTLLRPFHRARWLLALDRQRERVHCQFQALHDVIEEPGPKLVWFHVTSPHPPFLFRADGRDPESLDTNIGNWLPRSAYVEQLRFVNGQLRDTIEQIVQRDPDAVVVLQSDHGPASLAPDPWKATPSFIGERLPILNAWRWGKAATQNLKSTTTPVNTFRILLNKILGFDLPLLDDRMHFVEPGEPPQRIVPVTGLPVAPRPSDTTN